MSPILKLVLLSTGLLSLTQSLPTAARFNPIPPSQDSWYSAPLGYESLKPGTVLRHREIPGDLAAVMPGAAKGYNLLYRTTDSHYNPSWAVTTLFVPRTPSTLGNFLLSYQIPYDSVFLDASPSYSIYTANNPNETYAQKIWQLETVMVAAGWYLNIPDYEGANASFGAGVTSGHAVIDSIRAALSFGGERGMPANTKYAMWGYSGGAFATEWAAELQVQYAPEMNFSGAVMGGLTPNITNVLGKIDGKAHAGLIPTAMMGISSQYPEARAEIINNLNSAGQYNKTTFLSVQNKTLGEAEALFSMQSISKYFTTPLSTLLAPRSTLSKAIYRDGIMGYHGVPTMPMFFHQSTRDEISPIEDTDNLVKRYCEMGAIVEEHRNNNTKGGHLAEAAALGATCFVWLADVFKGAKDFGSGCSNVTMAL
ncbi:secretory lipase-domain-containing protein [Tricladium varicosporioides]|nr:secretory lipase-domain-containing protein [Hymenoscyphus varicosporioides]